MEVDTKVPDVMRGCFDHLLRLGKSAEYSPNSPTVWFRHILDFR